MTETLRKHEDLTGLPRLVRLEIADARQALDGPDPQRAVHEARKAIKRARAIARLLRAHDRETAGLMNAAARRAGHVLAEARDADSLEELARALAGETDDDAARAALSEIAGRAKADGARIDRQVAAEQAGRALDAMDRALAGLPPLHDPEPAVARDVARTWRRAVKRLDEARTAPDGPHLHELRKRAQDWRYQATALKHVWPGDVKRRKAKTDALVEVLGLHHDLTRLARRLDSLAEAAAARDLVEARCDTLAAEALQRAEAIFGRKPKKTEKALKAGF